MTLNAIMKEDILLMKVRSERPRARTGMAKVWLRASTFPSHVCRHCNCLLCAQIDVEGWEWSVMKGAGEMLEKYKVENVIMEYSPGMDV